MIALDIGGTKTLIRFSKKKTLLDFMNLSVFPVKELDTLKRYCIIDTKSISEEKGFREFLSLIKSLDQEIISTFPGIVRIDKDGRFRVFSRRFPFLMGEYLDLDFVVNDAPAFTYNQACRFFSEKRNRDKTLMGVVIGTGINACYMNYLDFRKLTFLNRYFEAGHIRFGRSRDSCFCGRKGCAELYTSGVYLERVGEGDPKKVFSEDGLREEYYRNLAEYILSLILIVSPHVMVFGGRVSEDLDLDCLRELVGDIFPHSRMDVEVDFRKDTSRLSIVEGLEKLYRAYRKGCVDYRRDGRSFLY